MESRKLYLPWYRIIRGVLGDLVEDLDEKSTLEYISSESGLTVPLRSPSEESRPLPVLEICLHEESVDLAVTYRTRESLRLLRNILQGSQKEELEVLEQTLRSLPLGYETRLMKRGFKDNNGFTISRKYIANRVDGKLVKLLIDVAETLRTGGRRIIGGTSIYEVPATPLLNLIFINVKKDEIEFNSSLQILKPIISRLSAVKTQREIIHSRVAKPLDEKKQYHDFVELLLKARDSDRITSEERRSIDKKWRENPEDRKSIEEELEKK